MQQFTRAEVAEHCTRESCWVVIDRNVYDLTNYLSQHPPGAQMILNLAQKNMDAKRMFSIHSSRAKALWESFLIGTIVD